MAPDSGNYYDDQSFLSTTSGQNAVGLPPGNDANSYQNYTGPNGTFSYVATGYDFSMGVIGIASAVPAPPSLLLLGIGMGETALRSFRARKPGR